MMTYPDLARRNNIMYDGMRSTTPWCAAYFVAVVLIGTYLVVSAAPQQPCVPASCQPRAAGACSLL